MSARFEWVLALALIAGAAFLLTSEPDLSEVSSRPAPPPPDAEIWPPPTVPFDDLEATSFSAELPTSGMWRGKPATGDLNGDGHTDLVCSIRRWDPETPGEGLYVYLGDGAGTWTASTMGLRRDMGYGGAELGDFNGDDVPDIAFSGHDVTPHVFLNDGEARWTPSAAGLPTEAIHVDMAVGDIDQDGHQDVVSMGFYGGGMSVQFGNGLGGFHDFGSLLDTRVGFGSEAELSDIDGDGVLEIAAATYTGARVWRYMGGEFIDMSEGLPQIEQGKGKTNGTDLSIDLMDLDGDGVQEILLTGMRARGGYPSMDLFRFDGETWASWGGELPQDTSVHDAEFARLVPDGPISIVAGTQQGIRILDMTEPGVFVPRGRIPETTQIYHLTVDDLIHDDLDRQEIVYVGQGGVRIYQLQSSLAQGDSP